MAISAPEDFQLIHNVSRETMDRIYLFVDLFEKWSKSINLVAPSTLSDVWQRHVADSIQLYRLNPGPNRWLDLGSGGGFPGIITAILLRELGAGHVDLVESNNKKAAFLRNALMKTDANGTVHAIRIESAAEKLNGINAISARALTNLSGLLTYMEPWMIAGATGWLHKGRDYQAEIDNARRSWDFDLVEHISKIDADSIILQISNARRRH